MTRISYGIILVKNSIDFRVNFGLKIIDTLCFKKIWIAILKFTMHLQAKIGNIYELQVN